MLRYVIPALGLTIAAAVAANAADTAPRPTLPADYATSYTNYYSNDRSGVETQAIRSFANDVAITSARETGEVAYGGRLIGELWSVLMDSDGEPIIGTLGAKIPNEHIATIVMERIEGADAAYDDGMAVGDWAFAFYNPDGTAKGDGDFSSCRSCHQPLADQSYLFTYEYLAKKAVE